MSTTINIAEDFRIVSDGSQYILEHRRWIDPTKSPNWSRQVAEAEAAGNPLPDANPREEWGGFGHERYYPMTFRGLAAAVEYVAIRSTKTHGRMEFAEYVAALHETTKRILGVVSPALADLERKSLEITAK